MRLRLLKGSQHVFNERYNEKWSVLNCFTKTGEWNDISVESLIENALGARPRQIWGPSDELKCLAGWFNRAVLRALKKILPGFMCGYNVQQMGEALRKKKEELAMRHGFTNVSAFTFDGSAHDSHQDYRLINNVDSLLWRKVIPLFADLHSLPEFVIESLEHFVLDETFTAYAKNHFNGTEYLVYKVKVRGTVFSGHPTRTTVGNSLRTLSYVTFLVFLEYGEQAATSAFFGKNKDIFIAV
jgi:hypothetical protein